jgi:hypothetical protein
MTIGTSIFLIAVGAILRYATDFDVQDVSVDTVGLILMIAGAVGLLISLIYMATWRRRGYARGYDYYERRGTVPPEEAPPPPP